MSIFKQAFLTDFFQSIHERKERNWDYLRFTLDHPRANHFMVENAVGWMNAVMENLNKYERAFEMMSDEYSKALMVKLLEFDILDHHYVKLPLNTPEYWGEYESVDEKYLLEKDVIKYNNSSISLYQVPELDLKIYGNVLTILNQFILKQYYYTRGPLIKPELGDVCLDAGSCRGEVSLHFASSVGQEGRVYGFEFVPGNIEIFKKNLDLNPQYASNITIVQHPLWHTSGVEMNYSDSGPSSTISGSNTTNLPLKTTTLAIDDFVQNQGLNRLDFIKMDIEGAEENALKGARQTIKHFKPKLAICVYHKKDDFYTIPSLIKDLNPGYAFYLDHYTIHREETVLYAIDQADQ